METQSDNIDQSLDKDALRELLCSPAFRRNFVTDKLTLGTLDQIFGASEAERMCEPDVFERARESAERKIYGRRTLC